MFRTLIPLLVLCGFVLAAPPARASGDFTCDPAWKLNHTSFTGCDSTAILGPGNDTRVNLMLLMGDKRLDKLSPANLGGGTAAPFGWLDYLGVVYGKPAEAAAAADATPDTLTPASSEFASGEGSRCLSNASGASGFGEALGATPGPPADEADALSKARQDLKPVCDGTAIYSPTIAEATKSIKSERGKAFAAYLAGAAAFYDGDFDTAHQRFAGLRADKSPWLRETARYMLARVEVNRAQVGAFGQYGELQPDKVDAKVLADAEAQLRAYLRDAPAGRYAASARGLLRRVYWLGGARDRLMAEYAWQFAQTDPKARNLSDGDLAQEVDAKFLDKPDPEGVTDPILLAVIDLQKMRHSDAKDANAAITSADLHGQAPRFSSAPALFTYLLAAHAFFVEANPAEVLRLIPAEPTAGSLNSLAFSRLALRALALDAVKDVSAREAIVQLVPSAKRPFQRGALELALAMHDERAGTPERVFEPDSLVTDASVRDILLRYQAGPKLLRRHAGDPKVDQQERRTALHTLLYKEVTRGAYRAFVADLAMVPAAAPPGAGAPSGPTNSDVDPEVFAWPGRADAYACPALREVATQLAAEPRDSTARLCLAEFTRLNGFDHDSLDTARPADELGGSPSQFPGAPFSRQQIYRDVIADPAAPPANKAYALYRAVRCYAPAGNNDCGGKDVPIAQRKAWFLQLKSAYATSTWAKELSLYW